MKTGRECKSIEEEVSLPCELEPSELEVAARIPLSLMS